MVKEIKIGHDTYLFDEWQCADRYPGSPKPGIRWFRRLLTKNGIGYVSVEDSLADPRIEITETLTIHRNLFPSIIDMDEEYDILHALLQKVYPFPRMYTEAGNYDLAKKHLDRFLDAINNLLVFA